MAWLALGLAVAVALGVLRARRGLKDRRAGLDPAHPQIIRTVSDDPTGPSHRWSGSRGRP